MPLTTEVCAPSLFFAQVDGNGELTLDEVHAGLLDRGLSGKMAAPIVRDLDVNEDGLVSREEFVATFYSSRLCTVPTPQSEKFADLRIEAEAGCVIREPELRAIQLRQLAGLRRHIVRRCHDERWRNHMREALSPGGVTLYDAARYVIRPATFARRCSYVELVAIRAQRPKYLVAHWWGTPFFDLVSSLGAHGKDRCGSKQMISCQYWLCAFAVNQWKQGEGSNGDSITPLDPLRSGFVRALQLGGVDGVAGTVIVLDRLGATLSRAWCLFETHLSMSTSAQRDDLLLDVYTPLDGGRGVGLTDARANAVRDGVTAGGKAGRESHFPIMLAQKLATVMIERAGTSLDADRTRILNRVAGKHANDLDSTPYEQCHAYNQLNQNLRARLMSLGIVRCLSESRLGAQSTGEIFGALHGGKLQSLELSFDACGPAFTKDAAKRLAHCLPNGLVTLSLRLRGMGDLFLKELSGRYHPTQLTQTSSWAGAATSVCALRSPMTRTRALCALQVHARTRATKDVTHPRHVGQLSRHVAHDV